MNEISSAPVSDPNPISIENLPPELLIKIFRDLSLDDLENVAQVLNWKDIAESVCRERFPNSIKPGAEILFPKGTPEGVRNYPLKEIDIFIQFCLKNFQKKVYYPVLVSATKPLSAFSGKLPCSIEFLLRKSLDYDSTEIFNVCKGLKNIPRRDLKLNFTPVPLRNIQWVCINDIEDYIEIYVSFVSGSPISKNKEHFLKMHLHTPEKELKGFVLYFWYVAAFETFLEEEIQRFEDFFLKVKEKRFSMNISRFDIAKDRHFIFSGIVWQSDPKIYNYTGKKMIRRIITSINLKIDSYMEKFDFELDTKLSRELIDKIMINEFRLCILDSFTCLVGYIQNIFSEIPEICQFLEKVKKTMFWDPRNNVKFEKFPFVFPKSRTPPRSKEFYEKYFGKTGIFLISKENGQIFKLNEERMYSLNGMFPKEFIEKFSEKLGKFDIHVVRGCYLCGTKVTGKYSECARVCTSCMLKIKGKKSNLVTRFTGFGNGMDMKIYFSDYEGDSELEKFKYAHRRCTDSNSMRNDYSWASCIDSVKTILLDVHCSYCGVNTDINGGNVPISEHPKCIVKHLFDNDWEKFQNEAIAFLKENFDHLAEISSENSYGEDIAFDLCDELWRNGNCFPCGICLSSHNFASADDCVVIYPFNGVLYAGNILRGSIINCKTGKLDMTEESSRAFFEAFSLFWK